MELDAYLARIGFSGKPAADLETLRRLQLLHPRSIPFENLSPLLGEPVKLDLASLEDKLVTRRRGGWCFEQNLYFTQVLRTIGFEVKTLAARVHWNVPAGVTTARSHMLMRVMVAGEPYIADVGFGGLTLTAPLRLLPSLEQSTPHEPHRLAPSGDAFTLQAKIAGEWKALYSFDLHEQLQADYEVSNWYLANFPQSQFVTGILAARTDADGRHVLRNTRYLIHRAGGSDEPRNLRTLAELKDVLSGPLSIRLPDHPRLDAKLQEVIDSGR